MTRSQKSGEEKACKALGATAQGNALGKMIETNAACKAAGSRFVMKKGVIFILILALIGLQQDAFTEELKAVLKARLHVVSTNPQEVKTAKINPGSTINLEAEIKNIGNQPSAPGTIQIRFVMMKPLEDLLENRTYRTESLPLPVIYPGHVAVIKFTKSHQWPTIHDFVKQNWNMRHYEAVIRIEGEKEDKVIGYLPIFFSAHYYEGLSHEAPAEVQSR
jgi:hypothetical protein